MLVFSVDDDKMKSEAWGRDYNEFRSHSSLGNLTPTDFAKIAVDEEA